MNTRQKYAPQADLPLTADELLALLEKARVRDELDAYKVLVDILPGVLPLLDNLDARGIKTAIGSSSINAETILQRNDLAKRFDAMVDGNQIVNSKPNTEVFVLAAKKLALPPKACVVIEDATAGIDAAVAAGCRAVAVFSARGYPKANYSLPSMEALPLDTLLDILH